MVPKCSRLRSWNRLWEQNPGTIGRTILRPKGTSPRKGMLSIPSYIHPLSHHYIPHYPFSSPSVFLIFGSPLPARAARGLLLLAGDIEQNPGPPSPTHIQILQLNINGLKHKITELNIFIQKHNFLIIALQETKLHPKTTPLNSTPKIPGFSHIALIALI